MTSTATLSGPGLDASTALGSTQDSADAWAELAELKLSWGWLSVWAALTGAVAFLVATEGLATGSAMYTVMLVLAAVGSFIAPDMSFLVGAGDTVAKGSISRRAVPVYNAAHRLSLATAVTALIAAALLAGVAVPSAALIAGLSWMAHVSIDRAAGYGLRNADGSRDQH